MNARISLHEDFGCSSDCRRSGCPESEGTMKCPRCGEDVFVEGHPDSDPTINQSCDCELTQSEVDELVVQDSERKVSDRYYAEYVGQLQRIPRG